MAAGAKPPLEIFDRPAILTQRRFISPLKTGNFAIG
jgi:hypothetical protein